MIPASLLVGIAQQSTPDLLHDYGLLGLFILFALDKFWPWISKRMDKSQDANSAQAEAQQAREGAREERMVIASENMARALGGIERILTAVNVRLDVIERHLGLDKPVEAIAQQDRQNTQPRGRGAK